MSLRSLTLPVTLLFACAAFAQDPRGAISGTITDPTDAMIAGAVVRATHAETGVAASASTNASGSYYMPFLLPGMYKVTAELAGFKRFVRDNVEVRVGETVALPIRMEVGQVSESVEVVAVTPLLDTTGASLGQVIDQRRILELPQRGYNPMELTLLTPGVANATNLRLRKAHAPGAVSEIASEGSGSYNTEFQIDGITNMSSDRGRDYSRIAFIPPQAAVREFKMQTSAYDASVGRTMGAIVNVSTASGTNEYHGEAHYVLRHSALDAPNFFTNKASATNSVYQDHRHGLSIGGPLSLPRLYNGKNRTFWFLVYEDNRFGVPKASTSTVPMAAEKEGDFSALLRLGSTYQLYDPKTTTPAAGGRFSRLPFAGNIIPKNRLDTVGVNLANLYPLPNQGGTPDGRNNFYFPAKSLQMFYQYLLRLDHAFSENHRAFLRLHYDMWKENKNDEWGTGIQGIFQNRPNRGVALDDVIVLNPTLVLNLRYGLSSTKWWQFRRTRGWDLAGLGFSQNLLGMVDRREAPVPRVTMGAFTTLSNWEDPGDGVSASLTHSFAAHLTKLLGKHAMRFGVDYRVYRGFGNRRAAAVAPDFSFETTYTRGPLDNATPATIGQDLASMLLGVPAGSMSVAASSALQDRYFALYWQDDIKLTRKLAINVGLRYELETPMTERYNRLVAGFDFDSPNPIEAQARANYATRAQIAELPLSDFKVRGGLRWVNQGGVGRSPFRGEKNNVMPRIGFAYQINSATMLRGGYGMFYAPVGVAVTLPIQTGFSQSTPIQASLDSGLTYVATNANPLPTGLRQPLGPAGGLTTNLSQRIDFFNYNELHPYAQRWSLGVQRMLPADFVLDVSYVANRSTRLGTERQYNATPARYMSRSAMRDQTTIDFLSASIASPFRGLDPVYGANISRLNLLKPYPQFGDIVGEEPIGYSWYHSMQVQAEKRFSRGYTLQLGYTFSKLMEATTFLNATDPMPYECIASLDRPHRLTASGIWEVPLGKGRRFAANLPKPADFVLGAWQVGVILTRQSGAPLDFGNVIFNGDLKNVQLPAGRRDVDRWFNVDAGFNRDSRQQLQYNIRSFPFRFSGIRGDDQRSWDVSIVKDFPVWERLKVRFRADVYNALNQTNFGTPNRTPTSSSFGMITSTDGDARNWQLALKVQF